MKIYTKTGDKGETSLFTGQRVPKNTPFIIALGTVDECNSHLGAALAFFPKTPEMDRIREQIITIQHALFDLGAALATPRTHANQSKIERTRFDEEAIAILERWIDAMESTLPPLNAFILPGGHPAGALLHVARTVCRRAERTVLPLHHNAEIPPTVLIYLNRLSDYLFSLSRYVNYLNHAPETCWVPHRVQQEIT